MSFFFSRTNLNQQVKAASARRSLPAAAILVLVGFVLGCRACRGAVVRHGRVAAVNETQAPVANLCHPGNGIAVTQHPTGSSARRSPSAPSSIINTPRQPSYLYLFIYLFVLFFFFLARAVGAWRRVVTATGSLQTP